MRECTRLWSQQFRPLLDTLGRRYSYVIVDICSYNLYVYSIGSRMVRGGGARNMKYKSPPMATIFFMTSFNRDRGGHGPLGLPPPGSAADLRVVGGGGGHRYLSSDAGCV